MAAKNEAKIKFTADTAEFNEQITQANSAMTGLRAEMKLNDAQFKNTGDSAEYLKQKQQLLKAELEENAQKQQALNGKLEVAKSIYGENSQEAQKWATKLTNAKTEQAKLEITLNETSSSASELSTSMSKVGDELDDVGDSAQQSGSKLDGMFEKIGSGAVYRIGSNITDALMDIPNKLIEGAKKAVEVGSNFEAAMSNVAAISGATGDDLSALTEKAAEMGRTTKFSASEAADAMSYMAMAGWKTNDMLDGISGIMDLAAASGEDLATTSDIVTDALTAFGLKASDSAHFADIMAAASSNANTNVSMMGETFKYCAPIAGSLGFSAEDTAEAIGLMANSGIKASQAGTSLRTIMTKMSSDIKFTTASGKELVVHTKNADGSMRSLSDILGECREKFSGLSESEQANAAKSIAGQEAMSGFLSLMNAGQGDVDKLANAIQNCDGAASGMADTMQDNLKGATTEFQSAAEGLGIALYDKVKDPLTAIVKFGTGAINTLTDALSTESATQKFSDSLNDVKKNLEETNKEVGNAKDSYSQQAAEIDVLVSQMWNLSDADNKTEAEKQRLKDIVDQLNKTVPNLSIAYNDQTGKVNTTKEAVRELTDAYKEQIVQQTIMKGAQDLLAKATDAKVQLQIAENRLDNLKETSKVFEELRDNAMNAQDAFELKGTVDGVAYAKEQTELLNNALNNGLITLDQYNDIISYVTDDSNQYGNIINVVSGYISENTGEVDALSSSMGGLQKAYDDANGKAEEYAKAAKSIIDSTSSASDAIKDHKFLTLEDYNAVDQLNKITQESVETHKNNLIGMKDYKPVADESKTATDEYSDSVQKLTFNVEDAAKMERDYAQSVVEAYDKIEESTKQTLKFSITAEFDGGEDQTTEKINANLQSQIDGYKHYAENLAKIREYCNEGIITPEFLTNLESMGTEGANILEHITWTVENQGEYGVEQIQTMSDSYMQSLDMQSQISNILALDKIALDNGLVDIGSSDVDFSNLRTAIENQLGDADQSTKDSLNSLVNTAQQIGVKIPDGLEEGINNSSIDAETAVQMLQSAVSGQLDGLVSAAQKAGISLPKSLVDGIHNKTVDPVQAFNELMQEINGSTIDTSGVAAAGKAAGSAMTKSMTDDASKGASEAANTTVSELSSGISTQASTVTGTVSAMMANVRTMLTNGSKLFGTAIAPNLDTVSDGFADMAREIGSSMKQAETSVIVGVGKLRSALHTKLKGPDIAVPHFSMSGDFNAKTKQVPSVSVQWYAKGAVFDNATIIPTLYGLKGVGEAGPEAVAPVDVLQNYVAAAVMQSVPQIDYDLLGEKVAEAVSRMNMAIEMDGREFGRAVRRVSG